MITVLTGENVSELQQHLVRMKKEFAALRGDSGIETASQADCHGYHEFLDGYCHA